MASAKISSGIDRNTSTRRIRISSTLPPRKPARLPMMMPIGHGDADDDQRQVERGAGAPDDAVEHVAAIVGGAERMAGRAGRRAGRAPVARHLVGVGRVRLGDDRREQRHADHQDDDDEADARWSGWRGRCAVSSSVRRKRTRSAESRTSSDLARSGLGCRPCVSPPARRGGRGRRRSRRRRG